MKNTTYKILNDFFDFLHSQKNCRKIQKIIKIEQGIIKRISNIKKLAKITQSG